MAKGYQGPGFLWKVGTSHADAVTIAYCKEIKGPSTSVGKVDVTTQDSPDYTMEQDPTLIDPGTISTQLIFKQDNATHASLLASLQNRDIVYVEIYNNPPTNTLYWSGNGFFSKFDFTGPVTGPGTADVELTLTGKVTAH